MKHMGHQTFSWPVAVATVAILTAIALLAGMFPAKQARPRIMNEKLF